MPALGQYLRTVDFLGEKTRTESDVLQLLYRFDAYPPITGIEGYPDSPRAYHHNDVSTYPDYDRESKQDVVLNPHLTYGIASARYVMCYQLVKASPPPGINIGARLGNDPEPREMGCWTLKIPPFYHLTWTEKRIWVVPHLDNLIEF